MNGRVASPSLDGPEGRRVLVARSNCLTAIANHYGHPVEACSVDVLAAVNEAIRAGFDLGAELRKRAR